MASLELKLLGGFEGRLSSGPAIELPTKKTQLLLSFLALSPGTAQPREKLASLLWSDRGDEQAHHSLRHSLSALRKAFAELRSPPLVADREKVKLDPAAVEVDALEFEKLVAAGTPESLARACALYRGDLLEDISTGDPPFEEWLFYERARLHDLAVQAFERLLAQRCEAGATAEAIETAQRLLRLNPAHEQAHRALVRLLADQGRRAAALEQYQHCRSALKRELDVAPGPETEELYQQILHRQGRRSWKALLPTSEQPSWRWSIAAAVAVVLVSAGALAVWLRPWGPDVAPASIEKMAFPLPDKPSIAVLPFESLSDEARYQRLADGITEDLINDLARYRDIFVIARNSTFAYKGKAVDVRQVAQDLGVRYVMEGSIQAGADSVRVTAQLIDAITGHHVWANRYDHPLEKIFAVQDELTQTVSAALAGHKGALSDEGRKIARRKQPENLKAYDLYLLGIESKHRYTVEDNRQAQQLFRRAIALDPGLARAYVGLAWSSLNDAYLGWSDSPGQALENFFESARKAVELDHTDAEAHLALSTAYLIAKSNAERSLSEIDRALSLSPNNADVLAQAAWNLGNLGQGRKALGLVQRAMRLNPNYPDWYDYALGVAAYYARDFKTSIAAMQRAQSQTTESRLYAAVSYAQLGDQENAAEQVAELLKLDPEFTAQKWLKAAPHLDRGAEAHFLEGAGKAKLPGTSSSP